MVILRNRFQEKSLTPVVAVVVVTTILLIVGFVFYTNGQDRLGTLAPFSTMVNKKESATIDTGISIPGQDLLNDMSSDPATLTTTLSDVSGGNSSGTAYVLRKAAKLLHIVYVNLPPPRPGMVYEGWLVKKTPDLIFFSTGVMEKQATGAYMLTFKSDNLYEGYNNVVITLETEVDETPEEHMLEGEVK